MPEHPAMGSRLGEADPALDASRYPIPFGPYLLLERLGSGAMGSVYLARSAAPPPRGTVPVPIVVKQLHAELADDAELVQRFTHEARIAAAIDSPHVVRVYDSGVIDGCLYIAMEHVAGWPVSRILNELRKRGGMPPSIASAVELTQGTLRGLAALHGAHDERGQPLAIVHRDLSPKNIMLGEDGRTRLIDLGIGKSRLQEHKTATGAVLGSPGYMAPEQVLAKKVDHRADLYTVGLVLYELLTLEHYIKPGAVPMMLRASAKPELKLPAARRSAVPKALDAVVQRAVAIEPEARFQSAEEFLAAIGGVVPERELKGAIDTLIGDLLWDELSLTKTKITHHMMMGTGVSAALEVPVEAPMTSAGPATAHLPRPFHISPMLALAVGIPIVAAVGYGVLRLKSTLDERVQVIESRPVPVREVEATPKTERIVAAPHPVEATKEAAEPAAREAQEAPAKSVKRAVRAPPAKERARLQERTNAAAPEEQAKTIAERVDALTSRANALRRKLAPGSPERTTAEALLGELLQVRSLPRLENESGKVDELERRLRAIEH